MPKERPEQYQNLINFTQFIIQISLILFKIIISKKEVKLDPSPKLGKNLQLIKNIKFDGTKSTKTETLAIIRTGINPNEFDEQAYDPKHPELSAEELFWQNSKDQTTDQILLLGSKNGLSEELLTERRDLKYAKFNLESSEQDQIRHETIHPLIFDLTREIFGEIKDSFDFRMELVVGGFDWFLKNTMKDSGSVISFTFKGENQKTFYYFIFQFAIANAIKDSFWENPNAKENQQKFYLAFKKLISKTNQIREENSQNYKPNQDIILNYSVCLQFLPKITRQDVINNIYFLKNAILKDKKLPFKFEGFNFDDFEIWLEDFDGENFINNNRVK